jgi:tripartite-type tricarboxylate transporter receptor subunit TctC
MKPSSMYRLGRQCALSAMAALTLWCGAAQAQNSTWPHKTVKFVNAWPPGGPTDIMARAVSDVLQKQLGQPFIIDNKPGAAGNVGADLVAKSAPDGHTLLWGIDTTHTINPHLYKAMPFKDNDLKPVVVISSSGLLLGVHPSTGLRHVQDFLQTARDRSLNFSSAGNGSPGHLWVNMANIGASTRLVHVPYRGNTPAVMAVLSGEVDGGTLATPGMLPHVKAGKIKPLAVTSRKRSRFAPDVPTVSELGLKDLEFEVFYVVMAPGNTPEPLMQALTKAITDALQRPDMQTRLQELDLRYEGLTGSDAANLLKKNAEQYGRIVRATGMKVD